MAEIQQQIQEGGQMNGGGTLLVATSENFSSKRQRRPSVRLGDIGDQQYDSQLRRNRQWKFPKESSLSGKGSKTRTLTNLGGGSSGSDFHETLDGNVDKDGGHVMTNRNNINNSTSNLDTVAIGSWRVKDLKSKRGLATKRVRSNWVSKVEGNEGIGEKYSEDVDDDGFRDFEHEGSESPMREQSPIHSLENLGVDGDRGHGNEREAGFHRRQVRARVSSEGHHDGVELSGPSETDWRCGDGNGDSGRGCHEDGGVRSWLNGLGLGRYAPVFEIHEVDDEVLPMLTLDDLRDMGINAVGSRRKMFCAIQKLGKGFS